ncbi:DUF1707 SHOCT-like domain-containing protein [Streptomyces sp. 24-1644]|uniref:DUF1707 SHOCT-like domain-containing protein n=1 Tax=Streptomyces sp. 24-1644 TaxID=3457315 RepID=UPI003FA7B132
MDLEKQPQQPQPPAAPAGTTPAEPAPVGIRASDADRDRIADILRDAVADGRLTAEEHAERIDLVYRSKTVGDLEPLVRDLPAGGEGAQRAASPSHTYGPDGPAGPADNMVAVFSSSTRRGRWRVGGRTNAFALFGSIEIDLAESLFGQRLSVINVTSLFGSVEIRVPENISLRGSGTGIFGNFEVVTLESTDPEAPVVVVNGYSVFGHIEAKPKRGKLIANLHDQLRKRLGH